MRNDARWILLVALCVGIGFGIPRVHSQSAIAVEATAVEDGMVRVIDANDKENTGRLDSATEKGLKLSTERGIIEFGASELHRVMLSSSRSSSRGEAIVALLDGSKLFGKKLIGKEQSWSLRDEKDQIIGLGAGVVKSLQFRPLTSELQVAWDAALAERSDGDALVVLRPGNSVDRVNGLIREIKEGTVSFDLDGQVIDVANEKLLGVIWYRKPLDRVQPTVAIRLVDGGLVYAESFSIRSGSLEYQGQVGQSAKIPLDQVSVINYSHANLKWLSELEVLESKTARRIDWKQDSPLIERSQLPRMERSSTDSLEGGADLHFPSPGSFAFRVPDGFQRLVTRIERSDRGTQRSTLRIEVWQDDVKIIDKQMAASDDSLDLEVPLVAGKKVRLAVASSNRLMVGTDLRWIQPRLVR